MTLTLPLIIAALALPAVLFYLWSLSDRVVYRGKATGPSPTVYVGPSGNNAYMNMVGHDGRMLVVAVPVNRVAEFKARPLVDAQVVVRKRLFQGERVTDVTWAFGKEEDRNQAGDKDFTGVMLSALYLLGGMYLLGSPFLWASAVAFALSGFFMGHVVLPGSTLRNWGFNGFTYIWLSIMMVLCGFCTYATFQTLTIVTIMPGVCCAFAVGQLLGMLLSPRAGAERLSPVGGGGISAT